MALRLIVMRHAKSSWTSGAASDHDRPLNKRGRRDAPRIGRRIRELGWVPDRALSSDSARTRETWDRMADAFDDGLVVEFTPTLYHGGVHALKERIAEVPDAVRTLLALGHNPGWELAVQWLSGVETHLTTANAALLTTEAGSWVESVERPCLWSLEQVLRPKELGRGG